MSSRKRNSKGGGRGSNEKSLANLGNKAQATQKKMDNLVSEYSNLKTPPSPEIFRNFRIKYDDLIEKLFDIKRKEKLTSFNKAVDDNNIDLIQIKVNSISGIKFSKDQLEKSLEKGNLKVIYAEFIERKYFSDDISSEMILKAQWKINKSLLKNVKKK